jgi:hypoxanthine phosphoribosyltransferase
VCLLEGGGILSLAAVLLSRSVKHDILASPVILVDDVIDSGWTMPMAGSFVAYE